MGLIPTLPPPFSPSVSPSCCSSILYQDDKVAIRPSTSPDAQTFVNGSVITEETTLHHVSHTPKNKDCSCCSLHSQGDRVVFGGEHFFRFNHPLEVERGGAKGERGKQGFEYARNELIRVQTEK